MSRVARLVAAIAIALLTAPAYAGPPSPASRPRFASISGLVTMGRLNFVDDPTILPDNSLREANTHPGIYAGVVLNVTWQQLEPSEGVFDDAAIDQGLMQVRAYNARNPHQPLVAKLRVFGGPNAPAWAKSLAGGPVTLIERRRAHLVGAFWSVPYGAAWRRLQSVLAARYDTDPLVREVAISSCASSTDEPFVIPLNRDNLPTLITAGYTDAAMQRCLMQAPDDYAAWTHVALDYTFNPWRSIASGAPVLAPGFTLRVMDAFRARLGVRGVLGNHGITPRINPAAASVIAEIHRLGAPIEFQTRSPRLVWDAAVQTAEAEGVTELEVWQTTAAGGAAPVQLSQLQAWRAAIGR